MAEKKKGRIIIPYIITFVITLIIVGGAALFLFNYFELGKEDELPELVGRDETAITYEDSHTILLVLDTPDEPSTVTFALMRSIPMEKKLMFAGIPANMVGSSGGKEVTISDVYARGGCSEAVGFVENIFGIDIDRYMKFDSAAFVKICDIFGGVSYTPGVRIVGLGKPNTENYMVGSQIQTYLTYPLFADGEMQRAFTVGSVIAAMVNQSDGQRLADSLDIYFNTIIDMVDTNVTAVDYKKYKEPIKYMFEKGTAIAEYSYVTGSTYRERFTVDDEYCTSLVEEYFTEPEDEDETEADTSDGEEDIDKEDDEE